MAGEVIRPYLRPLRQPKAKSGKLRRPLTGWFPPSMPAEISFVVETETLSVGTLQFRDGDLANGVDRR